MTGDERDRVYQYAFRRYDSLGPKSLLDARERLCRKIMETTNISKPDFDDIIDDLIVQNNWSVSRAMAYFECVNIEDRI
jgi:hypothetical protein